MAEKTFKSRIVQKHDIEANWTKATNFIPMEGEIIVYDKDATHNYIRIKVGDGSTNVNALKFIDDNLREAMTSLIENVDSKVDGVSVLVGDTAVSEQISEAISQNKTTINMIRW